MNRELPFVSVLVPVHPHKKEVKSAEACKQIDNSLAEEAVA